ncbi:Cytochrome P450 71B34 [Acorus gramineus]|uniref:Cytochrome P450 71B34 n=1 Tax=Acorus gramineus TaxID=55184 RepID=A0AAV9AV20_ACOGR|nr:Cytochrome P450 71B34 [Acorus gramineus]
MLGRLPHRALRDISRKYGPIVQLRFGQFPTVLVSTPEAATQILKTHDSVFAGRPYMYAGEFLTYGGRNITASDYGTYWRNARKLCTVHLLSPHKVESFEPMRREEVVLFVKTINESTSRGGPINLTEAVDSVISNSTCRMLFGCRLEESASFNKAVKDVIALAGAINIADFIPFFRLFDVQGLVRRMKETSNLMDEFFERKIEEMQDLFVGGIDTALSTVEWIMSELLKHPKVMKKLREEIRSTIGLDRLVNESDLPKLEYLNMVVKEGFRLHPGAPLLAAHKALEDQEVMGYLIPKNTRIVINAWAIGRDPEAWKEPEEFVPERFIDSKVDFSGNDLRMIPFGSGRRKCPGMLVGSRLVSIVTAQLLHCFDWELPNGMSPEELDMEEEFGLSLPRKNNLFAVPTCRLHHGVI